MQTTWDQATSAHWEEMSGRAGRNDMPYILFNAVAERRLTDLAEVAKGVEESWTLAENPLEMCGSDPDDRAAAKRLWRDMFGNLAQFGVEYLHETEVRPIAELPRTITLYRGATDAGKLGWSWTVSFERAHWFATRVSAFRGEGTPRVWRVNCPREFVFAKFHESRHEDEHVILAERVRSRIRPVSPADYERLLG